MFEYKLPDNQGQPVKYTCQNNSLIIIGANGSGKSKLGAWMEQQGMDNVHRVSAQRSLNFGDYIQLKSFEQAENLIFYGQDKIESSKSGRWPWDGEKYCFTTTMVNDYENILAALIAKKNNQNEEFIKWCKEQKEQKIPHCKVPYTVIDIFQRIWNYVFPQRQINFDDAKVSAVFTKDSENKIEYKGKDMSDGERVALYLIAQCLCVPKGKTMIIDEPEIHLHKSIMNRLWTAIENECQDCLFIYITHDTQFAANHKQAKKIWVKSFDGVFWNMEEIKESILPEQLLLDILGNRKHVLFVEGAAGSYDTKLYSEIYKDYYIVPCGSCSTVISQTKAMRSNSQLHELQCFGIIDRDYRSNYELEAYKSDNIFTLSVAEVENLFLVEELLKVINSIMAFPDETRIDKVKKYIIENRFSNEINRQICEAVVAELKYKLTTANISKKSEIDAKQALNDAYASISYDFIKTEREKEYNDVLASRDYKQTLSVFNCKSLSSSTGHFFELDNKSYCEFVIRQLCGDKANEIKNAIIPYLPSEVPIKT